MYVGMRACTLGIGSPYLLFWGKSQMPHNLSRGNIATDIGYKVKDQVHVVQLAVSSYYFDLYVTVCYSYLYRNRFKYY